MRNLSYLTMLYQPAILAFERTIPHLRIADWRGGVLLRSTNWLGDLLMTLPATWQLRRLLPPGVPLWTLSPRNLAGIWKAAPWIDGVIAFEGKRMDSHAREEARAHRFGLGIVLPNSFGSALDLWRCSIPRRLGRAGNLRSLLLTDRLPRWHHSSSHLPPCHQLSYYLELVSALGKPEYNASCPSLQTDAAPAAAYGIRKGMGWLAIAPGAAFGPAKEWSLEGYAEVANALLAQGHSLVLVGNGKDAEKTHALSAKLVRPVLDLAGKTSLAELMSILSSVEMLFANDSGAMHLAAALGTPGTALFLSTDATATGPLGAPCELLLADVPCRPCFQRTCPLPSENAYRCRNAITPADVLQAIQKTLERSS